MNETIGTNKSRQNENEESNHHPWNEVNDEMGTKQTYNEAKKRALVEFQKWIVVEFTNDIGCYISNVYSFALGAWCVCVCLRSYDGELFLGTLIPFK